jgi:hypothetical protein
MFETVEKNKDLSIEQKAQVSWVKERAEAAPFFGLATPSVVSSPVIDGYRTKVEMTIGSDLEGKATVGFLV